MQNDDDPAELVRKMCIVVLVTAVGMLLAGIGFLWLALRPQPADHDEGTNETMSKQVRLRRGTTAHHATFTGADGEGTFDTDKKCLVVRDGVTPGGTPVDAVRLNPGGDGYVSQVIQSGLNILGDGDDGVALYVAMNAQVYGTLA